jgi:hypothetical protein
MREAKLSYLRIWSYVIFVGLLLFPVGLVRADWEKLDYKAPKDKEGNPEGVNTVAIAGKNNAYFGVGGSRLVHWDGKSFKEIKHANTGNEKWDIRNIVINSEKDIWVFGDNGLSLHYDGKKWHGIKNPMTKKGRREGRLWGSGCATPSKCFAGSRAGDLIEWDGKEWKLIAKAGDPPAEGARIYAMAFPSKSEGWMAGEAFVAKWDGNKWTKTEADVPRIYAMTTVGGDSGWMVGDGGAFFKFDGKAWSKFDVKGSFFRMRGVSCGSKDNCWAVGDAGAAFQWDGKGWKKVKIGTFDQLSRVDIAHGLGFMVTDKGAIYKLK